MIFEQQMIIESLLFVAGEPVSIEKIAKTIEMDIKTTKKIINYIIDKYETEKRGMIIIEIENSYQMCTNPIYFDFIKKLYKTNNRKILSQTLIETLAIIAYKQPITKSQIEEIRGVNCDHSVNRLMEYGLVCEKGRLNMPGRPILFATTEEFLKYFGFNNLEQMPRLNEDFDSLRKQAYKEVDDSL